MRRQRQSPRMGVTTKLYLATRRARGVPPGAENQTAMIGEIIRFWTLPLPVTTIRLTAVPPGQSFRCLPPASPGDPAGMIMFGRTSGCGLLPRVTCLTNFFPHTQKQFDYHVTSKIQMTPLISWPRCPLISWCPLLPPARTAGILRSRAALPPQTQLSPGVNTAGKSRTTNLISGRFLLKLK